MSIAAIQKMRIYATILKRLLSLFPMLDGFRCSKYKVRAIDDVFFVGDRLIVPLDIRPFRFADSGHKSLDEIMRVQRLSDRIEIQAEVVEPLDERRGEILPLRHGHTFNDPLSKINQAFFCGQSLPLARGAEMVILRAERIFARQSAEELLFNQLRCKLV